MDTEASAASLARAGMEVDLGAVAKGFAAREAEAAIRDAGGTSAMLDLGGNVTVIGAPKEAQEALNRVLRALGMPTCLEELGLKETPEEADRIFAFLAERMPVETPKELQRLRGESDVLFHGLRDSAGKLQTKRGEAHETGI